MTAPQAIVTNLQRANKAYASAIALRELAAELTTDFAPVATQLDAIAKSLITRAKKLETETE